jgi:signal-transduction protein with cAMP-binding, CBS, and nucleotidyltransferase domain
VLDHDQWDYLTGAFAHVTHLLLRQQLADFVDPNREVSNYVYPGEMTERERDMLLESFKAIDDLAERVESEFTGVIF